MCQSNHFQWLKLHGKHNLSSHSFVEKHIIDRKGDAKNYLYFKVNQPLEGLDIQEQHVSLHQNYSEHQFDLSEYHYTCHFQQDGNNYRLHSYKQMDDSFVHLFESVDLNSEPPTYAIIKLNHPALKARAEQVVDTLISDIQTAYLAHAKSIYTDYETQKYDLSSLSDPQAWYTTTQKIVSTFSTSAVWMPDDWFIGPELSFMRSLVAPTSQAFGQSITEDKEASEKARSKPQKEGKGKKKGKTKKHSAKLQSTAKSTLTDEAIQPLLKETRDFMATLSTTTSLLEKVGILYNSYQNATALAANAEDSVTQDVLDSIRALIHTISAEKISLVRGLFEAQHYFLLSNFYSKAEWSLIGKQGHGLDIIKALQRKSPEPDTQGLEFAMTNIPSLLTETYRKIKIKGQIVELSHLLHAYYTTVDKPAFKSIFKIWIDHYQKQNKIEQLAEELCKSDLNDEQQRPVLLQLLSGRSKATQALFPILPLSSHRTELCKRLSEAMKPLLLTRMRSGESSSTLQRELKHIQLQHGASESKADPRGRILTQFEHKIEDHQNHIVKSIGYEKMWELRTSPAILKEQELYLKELIVSNNKMYAKSRETKINELYCKQFIDELMQVQNQLLSEDTLALIAQMDMKVVQQQTLASMKSQREQLPLMVEAFNIYCATRKQRERPSAAHIIAELAMDQANAMGERSPLELDSMFSQASSALGINPEMMEEMEKSGECSIC